MKIRLKLAIVAGGLLAGALVAAPAQAQAAPVQPALVHTQVIPRANQPCPETFLCAYDYNQNEFWSVNGTGSFHLDANVIYMENLTGYTVQLVIWTCAYGNTDCGFNVSEWLDPHSGYTPVETYVSWVYIT